MDSRKYIAMLIIGMIGFGFIPPVEKSYAASGTITHYEQYQIPQTSSDGGVGRYVTSNGNKIFCTDHTLPGPATGTGYSEQTMTDAAVAKILYYGWDGPGQWSGFASEKAGVMFTSLFLSHHLVGEPSYVGDWLTVDGCNYGDFRAFVNAQGTGSSGSEYILCVTGPGIQNLAYLPKDGDITLTKQTTNAALVSGNSSYSLEGAVYEVLSGSTVVATATTDANGQAVFTDVPYGTYAIREKKASPGYALDTASHSITVDSSSESITVMETPQTNTPATLVQKKDAGSGKAKPEGNASLAGAEYTVRFYAGQYASISALPATPSRTWKFKTDANGTIKFTDSSTYFVSGSAFYKTSAGAITLPLGTITVQETKAPAGYLLEGTTHLARITSSGTGTTVSTYTAPVSKDAVRRGQLTISKTDVETGTEEQGDATFAGAKFSIINNSANPVVVDGKEYAKGAVCKVITTNANGVATTGARSLPYGSYTVTETTAPEGYLNTGTIQHSFTVTADGQVRDLTKTPMVNDVIRGGFLIEKWDKEFDKPEPSAETELTGIEFTVTNESKAAVMVEGVRYEPGDVITVLKSAWDEEKGSYTVQVPDDYLPYGTYHVTETATNSTYVLTDGQPKVVKIRNDGEIVTQDADGSPLIYKNYTVRNDVKFVKQDAKTGDGIPNIPFRITNITTGESHVIVSDENGIVSTESAHALHSANTNANDAVSGLATITESDVDPSAGVWFSRGEHGSVAAPIDAEPALPYGTYRIDELRCQANQDRELIQEIVISVYRDPSDGHGILDLGVLTNHHTTLDTLAQDKEMGLKGTTPQDTFARDEMTIVDAVDYTGVEIGKEYTLTTTAVDASTGQTIMKGDEPAQTVTTFIPDKTAGELSVELEVDLLENAGDKIVVCQLLTYEEGGEVYTASIHADTHDRDQTINLCAPELKTTALNAETGRRLTRAGGDLVISDKVTYSGLISGQSYTMRGTLVDGETGDPIMRNGVVVTASETFYSNRKSGEITLTFPSLDTTGYEGRTITVFEELIWEGSVVGEHKDLTDEEQQIQFPKIATNAWDEENKSNVTRADKDAKIIDTVTCHNLAAGETYLLKAVLMDKKTGKALEIDGEKITAEKTFVPIEETSDVDVSFSFDAESLAGKTAVVYESLYLGDELLASHRSINDRLQTIHFPAIDTSLRDSETGKRITPASDQRNLVDTVNVDNLIPEQEYVLSGSLVYKDTGKPVEIDGEAVTASTTFMPQQANESIDVTYRLDASFLEGKTVVSYQTLSVNGYSVADHHDLADADQTVHIEEIQTVSVAEPDTPPVDNDLEVHSAETDRTAPQMPGVEDRTAPPGTVVSAETGDRNTTVVFIAFFFATLSLTIPVFVMVYKRRGRCKKVI